MPEKLSKNIITGLMWGMIATLLLLSILAALIYKGVIGNAWINIILIAVNILACIVSGMAAVGSLEKSKLMTGAITGILYGMIAVIIACAIDITAIDIKNVCRLFVCSIVGNVIGSMFNLCKSNKKYHKKRKPRA